MSQQFLRAIYTRLNADTGGGTNPLRTLVSDRIYGFEAPAQTELPLVLFSLDDTQTERFFDGKVKSVARFTVTSFGKSEAGANALLTIDTASFALLDQEELAVTSHDRGIVQNLSRGAVILQGEFFQIDSSYQIVGTSTT